MRNTQVILICKTCQKGGKLNADHIKRFADFPTLRLDISNGKTLCECCHRQTITFGNKKQMQWQLYYLQLQQHGQLQ